MAKGWQEMRVIEDQGKPVVIFPLAERKRYEHLLRLAGYRERSAIKGEAESLPHLVHTVPKRQRKIGGGDQLALFGRLPEVRRCLPREW